MKPKLKNELIARLRIIVDDPGCTVDDRRDAGNALASLVNGDPSPSELTGNPRTMLYNEMHYVREFAQEKGDDYIVRCCKETGITLGFYVPVDNADIPGSFIYQGKRYAPEYYAKQFA